MRKAVLILLLLLSVCSARERYDLNTYERKTGIAIYRDAPHWSTLAPGGGDPGDPNGSDANDTEVIFNDGGLFAGDPTFTFVESTGLLSVPSAALTNLTAGSVLFAGTGGLVSEDNSELFWDDTNNRLGIGTNSPTQQFELRKTDLPAVLLINSVGIAANQRAILQFSKGSTLKWDFGTTVVSDDSFYIREGGSTNRLQIAPTTGVLTHTGDGVKAGGYLDMPEISAPATPATNDLRLYTEAIQGFSFFKYYDDTGMKRQLLRDSMILVYNDTGFTLASARIVYASGSISNVPTIALAKADSLATMPAIGVTIETIANGAFGRIMQVGLLENVNTATLAEGDVLYVSAATAGVPTTTIPVTPNLIQEIGTVLVSDASAGAIQIVTRSVRGDEYGTIQNDFYIGDGTAGSKTLHFNAVTDGSIIWDETKFDLTASPLLTTGSITAANAVLNGTVAIGLDMSTGTFTTSMQNWPTTPVIHVAGTQFLRSDNANENMFFGDSCFVNNTATKSLGFGFQAGFNTNTGADYSIFIGYKAGYGAGGADLTGSGNVCTGYQSGYQLTTGYDNCGYGYRTLYAAKTARECMAFGKSALFTNVSGIRNTAVGKAALEETIGSNNLGIGYNTLKNNGPGLANCGIGNNVGFYMDDGDFNTFVGYYAAFGKASMITHDNTGIGAEALYSIDNGGNRNTAVGYRAGYTQGAVADCVYLGHEAGYYNVTGDKLFIDNQARTNAATELAEALIVGTFHATPSSQSVTVNGDLNVRHHLAGIPDEITATSAGVAASVDTVNTEVTTNGDSDLDNVTLANGTSGQVKHIYCVAVGNVADSFKITPATMVGGTQITFAASPLGLGCTLVYADNEGWIVVGNNGGSIT